MPVHNSELFNTDPYYDDFDESKKFLRIMFRPSVGVQARELTQLQTIIQSQIERFGSHIFEEGSIVSGGKVSINALKYARVSGLSGTSSLTDFVDLVGSGTSRARARIVHTEEGLTSSSVDDLSVIYFDYLEGGTGFTFGDVIGGTAADGSRITANVTGSWSGAGPYPVGDAYLVSVDSGVRFIEGFFVYHEAQKLGAYSLTGAVGSQIRQFASPTNRMGFDVVKGFVDSDSDTSLNDPAYGAYNYNAPGADRYQIDLNLIQYGFTANNTSSVENFARTDFVEFLRFVGGTPVKIEKYPDYAQFEDTLARRTYDESGNYTVRPFEINMVNGPGITTDASTATIYADLEPGKAYIFGHEFETQSVTRLELEAPRTAAHVRAVNDIKFTRSVGPYCEVVFSNVSNSLTGFIGFEEQQPIYLSKGASGTYMDRIGSARVRSIHPSGSLYRMGLFNVEMSGTAAFDDVTRIFLTVTGPTHAFEITGTNGLVNTSDGDLLYVIPSGSRCSDVTDANYAVWGFFEHTMSGVSVNGSGTLSVSTSDYVSHSTEVEFSITNENYPHPEIILFNKRGPLVGTATLNAPDTLDISINSGTTNGETVWVAASIDVSSIAYADGLARAKTPTALNITSGVGGFTGTFAGLTSDSLGNSLLYFAGKVDVHDVLSLTGFRDGTSQQVKDYFVFDNGQRDNLYDWSRMVLISGVTGVTGPFTATVEYYARSGTRGPFTVNSYSGVAYSDIPDYTSRTTGKTYNLADVIDFRPDRGPSGNVIGNPWIPTNTAANDNVFSYEHYLPRTDKIVLKRDKTFGVIEGVPSLGAITPPDDPNAMTLYTVTLNPYTYDKKDLSVRYTDNRRYTMRDIGDLEKRVEAVEYYTTLSLLEQEAKSISIVDDTGVEIPKKGILVDQFKGHNIGDVTNSMYEASIDFEKNELRPPFTSRVFGLSGPASISGLTSSSDGIVTLNYTTRNEIVQPLATAAISVNPSAIFNYLGTLAVNPPGDYWFDEGLTPSVRVNVDGENDAWESGSGFGSQWNDWESIWYGREVQNETNTKQNLTTQYSIVAPSTGINLGNIYKSGVPESIKRKANSIVTRKDVIPYVREQDVSLDAKGLKPNTRFYVFLDDIDITGYCTGGSQYTDSRGECSVTYLMSDDNANEFLAGKRTFRITDDPNNTASTATMAADAIYHVGGSLEGQGEDGVLSTRSPVVRRRSVKSNKVQSNLTEVLSTDFFGFVEPLSQTFYVDPVKYPDGVFIKSVGVAFSAVPTDDDTPITMLVKPTVSGYPHPSKVLPFGQSTVYAGDITTSEDGSTETDFSFSSPIYLIPGFEYAISLFTNSSDYSVYKASIGQNIINNVDGADDRKATKQPGMRSLFTPQNTGSLKRSDTDSLRFSLGVCIFSSTTGMVTYNTDPGAYVGTTYYDAGRIVVNHAFPSSTSCAYSDNGFLSTGGEVTFQPNKNFDRASVASRTPLSSPTTFKATLYGTTYVSPILDSENSHYLVIRNLVNNNSNTGTNNELSATNYGATSPSLARYITKQITLEEGFEGTNIHVQMSLCNPYDSTIQVFVRPLPLGEGDYTNLGYTQLTRTDAGTDYTENPDTFREVTYTSSTELQKFRSFAVKIVMYSGTATTAGSDPRSLPRIKNLRIVAT